jgi:hypothetical protein
MSNVKIEFIIGAFKSPFEGSCFLVLERKIEDRQKFYLRCIPGLKARGCYWLPPGWGQYESCNFVDFKIETSDRAKMLAIYEKFLNSENETERDIARLIEMYLLEFGVKCDVCNHLYFSFFNLFHYNTKTGGVVCDLCANQEDPKIIEKILFG